MNKKKVAMTVAIFFLVQVISSPYVLSVETCVLNPQTKVSLNKSEIYFKQVYDMLCLGLSIYKSDAIERQPRETLVRRYSSRSFNSDVRFDLEHIDLVKKGWARYYPFYIGERCFIVRIFLTEERAYQPKLNVIYEATVENPAVTLQVLPGINAILEDCNMKPQNLYPVSETATSP